MSRLYIRLMTGFYTHRKTLRLKARIGNDAFWVPPRLWTYCAENQPDGDLRDYSAEEISELVAYKGDAQALLVALKDCGFMELDGCIHGWSEHNGFHSVFSERAKSAAAARWGKKRKKTVQEKEKEKEPSICLSNASSIDPLEVPERLKTQGFMNAWTVWQTYRRGMKKPGNWQTLFKTQLDWLSQFNAEKATEILKSSVRNGWQGLFEPKDRNGMPERNGSSRPDPVKQAERL